MHEYTTTVRISHAEQIVSLDGTFGIALTDLLFTIYDLLNETCGRNVWWGGFVGSSGDP
jgi:hypothetical protein